MNEPSYMKHAASISNPPRRFRNLDVSFDFARFCDERGYRYYDHEIAIKEFCALTGEEYKKDW